MWPETRVGPQRQCKIRKLVGEKEPIVDQTLKHVYNYFFCVKNIHSTKYSTLTNFMCIRFACAYVYAPCAFDIYGGQKQV